MVVQKQFINSPLSASLNTKLDPKTAPFPGFSLIENAIRTRVGEVRKRFGYVQEALTTATYPQRNGTSDLVQANNYQIIPYEDEAALISAPSGGDQYIYRPRNSTWNSYSQSRIPKLVTTNFYNVYQNTSYSVLDADIDYIGNQVCVVYSRIEQSGIAAKVYAAIFDVSTETVIKAEILLTSTEGQKPRVIANGNLFQIFWLDYSGGLKSRTISSVTGVLSAEVTVASDVSAITRQIEVVLLGNTGTAAVAYTYTSGGPTNLKVISVTTTGTTVNTYTSATYTVLSNIGLYFNASNSRLYGSFGTTVTGTSTVVGFALSTTLTAVIAPLAVTTGHGTLPSAVAICANASNVTILFDNEKGTTARSDTLSSAITDLSLAGAVTTDILNNSFLASTLDTTTNTAQGYNYLTSSLGSTGTLFYTANLTAKIQKDIAATSNLSASNAVLPSILNIGSLTITPVRIAIDSDNGTIIGGLGLSIINNTPDYVQTVAVNGITLIGGGTVRSFDGQQTTEVGWHTPALTPIYKATGSGTIAAGAYQYVAVYEWSDLKGNLHRSQPSIPLSVTSPGTASFDLQVENYGLTTRNISNGYSNQYGKIVLYRTKANGTIFFRYREFILESNDQNVNRSFTDNSTDAQLGNEILYTTGGVLENEAPPASYIMNSFKNRVFIVPSEDRNTVWYSEEVIQNEIPVFSSFLTFSVETLGGQIMALSEMDDKIILFKENAIFYTYGDGANNLGQGAFNPPSMLTQELGCIDARSIARTNEGIIFKSKRGFYLLDRGLNVSYIGAPVELYNSATITSAINFPSLTQTRFTTSNGYILVYESTFKEWYYWNNLGSTSACMWEGRYAILKTDKNIWRENSLTPGYADNNVAVTMRLITFPIQVADIQGFQRLFRIILLGEYRGEHTVKAWLAYDHKEYFEETFSITPTSAVIFTDSTYQNTTYTAGGTTNNVWQFEIRPAKQMCSAVRIMIADDFTGVVTPGNSFAFSAIGFEIGALGGRNRVPPTTRVMT